MNSNVEKRGPASLGYALATKLQDSDWRGIIALVLVVGFLLLLWRAETEADMKTISSILSGLVGLIIGYYFGQAGR